MPNNFKLTGDYYVSKFGNDAWSGTSPDAPKRTIQAMLNAVSISSGQTKNIIIGSGVYRESITINFQTGFLAYLNLYADGNVVLQQLGSGYPFNINIASGYGGPSGYVSFFDFIINNVGSMNLNYSYFQGGVSFYRCKIIGGSINSTTAPGSSLINNYSNCTFIGVTIYHNSTISIQTVFNYCIFINCALQFSSTIAWTTVTNSYFNSSTILTIPTNISSINYNNIQGVIITKSATALTTGTYQDTYGRYYSLVTASSTGDGTAGFPYGRPYTNGAPFNLATHKILYPTLNPSSSAVDPKFNSIEDQDFTLQADSWHIGRASDGISNIGGTNYALRRAANISFSGSSATVDPSLIFQYNNYVISGSELTGSITSAPIAVSPLSSSKVIQKVTYNGLLAFNKDTGSASGSNQNVPDFDTFTSASGNAGANPDRLVYYMRHTTGSSIPVSDAGWDNGGLWTAGQYNVFEWNTKPSIDNLGVGNGSGSFNAAASPTYIQATYVQMRVRLRNDYLL